MHVIHLLTSAMFEVCDIGPSSPGAVFPNFTAADRSYYEWIEARRSDTAPADRDRADLRRQALRDETGMCRESYRFVDVAGALLRF